MSISSKNQRKFGIIDEVRLNNGIDRFKDVFKDLVNNNPNQAADLINNEKVLFPSLFILESEIRSSGLFTFLSTRNRNALEITNEVLYKDISNTRRQFSENQQDKYTVLKWMLETGYREDGLNDQYDEVLETAAILLSRVYKDKGCLRTIEDLIFKRHRKGAFIYDLVWAFFEASDPESLFMVINRLRSPNMKDIELARKFLNFIPCIGKNYEEDPIKQYNCSLKWLNQNQRFLYYTGETYLQTTNPCRYAVSLEAKYLQKTTLNIHSEPTLTDEEFTYIDRFKRLDDESKLNLSNYSDRLFRISQYKWSKWLQNPIDVQVDIAKRILGGRQ